MRLLLLLALVPLTACVEGDSESAGFGKPVIGVGQLSFDEDGGADHSDTGPQDGSDGTSSEEPQGVPPGTYTFEEFVALVTAMSPEFADELESTGSSGPPPADQDLVEVVPTPAPAGPCGISLEPSAPSASPSELPAALWETEVSLEAALAALQPSDLDTLEGALESLSRMVMPLPEEPDKVVEPW